jgi:hypothetical protein
MDHIVFLFVQFVVQQCSASPSRSMHSSCSCHLLLLCLQSARTVAVCSLGHPRDWAGACPVMLTVRRINAAARSCAGFHQLPFEKRQHLALNASKQLHPCHVCCSRPLESRVQRRRSLCFYKSLRGFAASSEGDVQRERERERERQSYRKAFMCRGT